MRARRSQQAAIQHNHVPSRRRASVSTILLDPTRASSPAHAAATAPGLRAALSRSCLADTFKKGPRENFCGGVVTNVEIEGYVASTPPGWEVIPAFDAEKEFGIPEDIWTHPSKRVPPVTAG